MRAPRFLLGAAVMFWGWQTGHWLVGLFLAIGLESPGFIRARWDLEESDFRQVWSFCTVAFIATALYAFAANEGPAGLRDLVQGASGAAQREALARTTRASLTLFRWGPAIFFLFVLAQAYSNRPTVELATLSVFARWTRLLRRRDPQLARQPIQGDYPYFGLCLFASCLQPEPNAWLYPGICVLVGWALWSHRSSRFQPATWLACFGLAAVVGFGLQRGFYFALKAVEGYQPGWFSRVVRASADPKQARTALGSTLVPRLSGRIVLRVQPLGPGTPPTLLREASYQSFRGATWYATRLDEEFSLCHPEPDQTTWHLGPFDATNALRIGAFLREGRGLLALPPGVSRLERLPVYLMRTNALGAALVDSGPGLVIYNARYGDTARPEAPPGPEDLAVPGRDAATMKQIASELRLSGQSPEQILGTVSRFFAGQFTYSLAPHPHDPSGLSPVAAFLLRQREGHCEYFATATALLLRQAGLPTRYAVGYVLEEKSRAGYLVRERHAHAWCLVYAGGVWRDFDTTPATRADVQRSGVSWFEPVRDLGSDLWYAISKWRWGHSNWQPYVGWVLGPVLGLLLTQLVIQSRRRRSRQARRPGTAIAALPGMDSDFYRLERALAKRGYPRPPSETAAHWLRRCSRDSAPELRTALEMMVALHYRYRFDPGGLQPAERETLRHTVRDCLDRLVNGGGLAVPSPRR